MSHPHHPISPKQLAAHSSQVEDYYKESTIIDLPGVEVIARTTVKITKEAQYFNWSGYGFTLHVRQGSLPPDIDHCVLYIFASLAGQYQLPKDLELVSAVFWVRCVPSFKFKRKLTVEIQHCAQVTSSFNLKFVRAVCSQKSLPYTFKLLEGRGSFSKQSSYGSLELHHFSGVAVGAEGGVDRRYVGTLYYLKTNCTEINMYFTITWNEECHITEVRKYFEKLKAKERLHLCIEFVRDEISLNIPWPDGVEVQEWMIKPLLRPTLLKTWVDEYKTGRKMRHCHLVATLSNERLTGHVPKRYHTVELIGAKEPDNEMNIEIESIVMHPVDQTSPVEGMKRATGVSDHLLDTRIIEEDFHTLGSYFDSLSGFIDKLYLNPADRADVETRAYSEGLQSGVAIALRLWRRPNPSRATYRALIDIVIDLRRGDIAEKILEYILEKHHHT